MKLFACTLVAIGVVMFLGCQAKKKIVTPPPPVTRQVDLKPIPFVAPADSTISAERLTSWVSCNRMLDSLSAVFADSFKTEDPALRLRYQHAFTTAQAVLCLRGGLKSAYDEYRWITTALSYPENRALAARFNITVHR